jgi:DNA (cytosine-5)-methyltransferase 1
VRIRQEKPRGVIVIGGPPCQPFSKNGYWVRNENRLAIADPRNMIAQFFRVVGDLRPDGFMLENVESILHPTNREAVDQILEAAAALGYSTKLFRSNAADFGVPQRRKRVFFFGTRRRINSAEPHPTHRGPGEADLLSNLPLHLGVGPLIERYAGPEYFEPQEIAEGGTYYEDLLRVPPGTNYIALRHNVQGRSTPKFRAGGRFWNFLLKLHPEETSWTIAANPGPWVGPFHWTSRRLRVPEVAAIQTFPEGYRFVGKRRSIQKQIGNAVPPLLAKNMVSFLVEHL